MDSVDLSVLSSLREWQSVQQPLWLVTVLETFGSSPRPPGAMLALRGDGLAVGSVSGGCIEDDLVLRAQHGELPAEHCEIISYGVNKAEARRFGLPCGGVMRLLVEPVHKQDWPDTLRKQNWLEQILQLVRAHRLVKRTLHLDTLQVEIADATRSDTMQFDGNTLTTVHGPRWRMLIIGAGQTSTYLARMAQALDYQVIVCDPRADMRATWDVPDTTLTGAMPDDAVLALQADAATVIIALTHDPKLDDMALLEALKSPACYVGALGSKVNNDKRRARLALFDLSPQEIDRLHGPVGLDIGSRTPPEIAVSILAHLIAVRSAQTDQIKSVYQAQPVFQLPIGNQEVCS